MRLPSSSSSRARARRFSSSSRGSGDDEAGDPYRRSRRAGFIGNGSGDTPLGKFPDPPIVVRWSLYRNALTFRQGKKNEGGASTWLKPWRKVSESPATKPTATGFPTGTFETKITPADLRNTAFPLRNAHWETLTFKRTWRDVWFHPRRADQPVAGGRYVVHGNELTLLPVHDVVRWSYYRGQLTFRIVDVADAFGRFTYTVHPWRRVS